MSNSVVFLLIAVGLSVVGATAVWLHGLPRRHRNENHDFGATLRALGEARRPTGPTGVRPMDTAQPARSPRDPRRPKDSDPGT